MPHCSCPHQPVKQSPRKDKSRQPVHQPARPELEGTPEVPARVERGLARSEGRGRHAHEVEEYRREEGEDQVEEESAVRLEAEDARAYAEQGGGEGLEVMEGLWPDWLAWVALATEGWWWWPGSQICCGCAGAMGGRGAD